MGIEQQSPLNAVLIILFLAGSGMAVGAAIGAAVNSRTQKHPEQARQITLHVLTRFPDPAGIQSAVRRWRGYDYTTAEILEVLRNDSTWLQSQQYPQDEIDKAITMVKNGQL